MDRTRLTGLILTASLLTACGFEETKPAQPGPVAPLAERWCPPADLLGVWTLDATSGVGTLIVDGRELRSTWTFGTAAIEVERRLGEVLFERQRWTLDADAQLVARVVETPAVLAPEDELLVRTHALDDLQALREISIGSTWSDALVGAGAACDRLPSAYGHGYPAAEGWYVAGASAADGASVASVAWYGHGGDEAGAPFAPARSLVISLAYDGDERMVEEVLNRGAADGGPHDRLRARTFDVDGRLLTDRMERWSPTPKEDIVRVMRFADEGAMLLRRELADTWDAQLDVRWIPAPR